MFEKVVIIGNGMDIDHNFNTSYWDIFNGFEFKISEKIKNIEVSNGKVKWWNDFENLIASIAWVYYSTFYDLKLHKSLSFKLSREETKRIRNEILRQFEDYKITKVLPEKWLDHSGAIFEKLINHISCLYDTDVHEKIISPKSGRGKEYSNDFKDAFVINYNYTKFYENYYYNPSTCWYIHGSIDKSDYGKYSWSNDSSMETKIGEVGIMLGSYYTNYGYGDAKLKKKFCNCEPEANDFSELIGNTRLFFRKGNTMPATREYLDKKEEAKKSLFSATELIIIGHSVSGVDLPPLKTIMNWDATNIKKIKFYGHKIYEAKSEEEEWIIQKIKDIQKFIVNIDDIEIINNFKK